MYDTRRGLAPAPIDLRSDTLTMPTPAMRRAMADAEVGDDVYGEDPTVNRLERVAAEMLGKDDAMYCSSGTQSNLCGVLSHCGRGDEYLIGDSYHVFVNEAMGTAVLGSVAPFPLATDDDGGVSSASVRRGIKSDDTHLPVTRLLCLENTTNGSPLSIERLAEPVSAARDGGLSVHLDGARMFNAAVATGVDGAAMAGVADTVSICLSKGLGAPVGSVLVGPADNIARARRMRKMLGGGMRQAGVIAAAGLHALEHHVDRLVDDHQRAAAVAAAVEANPLLTVIGGASRTNMVWVAPAKGRGGDFADHLAGRGINVGPGGSVMRMVTHLGITDEDVATSVAAIDSFE